MKVVRPYLPLIGFVVPTVVIGYGFVIPRSCIAGVNELTIGFGTTILGAIGTYIAGQRAVMPSRVCTKPALSVRLSRAINRQAASPSGLFGRLLGFLWKRQHSALNREVLAELDVRPGHHVLEVGSGPGEALHEAARRAHGGKVLGIDVSALMVRLARKRNRQAVARGDLDVRVGDGSTLALDGRTFDRIFSVHCLYFWRDRDGMLSQMARALRADGKLVLAFRPEGDDIPARFRDPTYRFPRPEDLEASLRGVGLDVQPSKRLGSVLLMTATRK